MNIELLGSFSRPFYIVFTPCSPCALLGYICFKQLDSRIAGENFRIIFGTHSVRKGRTCADHKQIVLLRLSAKSKKFTQISLFCRQNKLLDVFYFYFLLFSLFTFYFFIFPFSFLFFPFSFLLFTFYFYLLHFTYHFLLFTYYFLLFTFSFLFLLFTFYFLLFTFYFLLFSFLLP